jgi:tRNA(fMet)-specific endonuclease VapC
MKYSLDTNTCIGYLSGRSPAIRRKLPTIPAGQIVVCSVVRAELAYGVAKSNHPEASAEKHREFLAPYASLPFDDQAAAIYGRVRKVLEANGTPIGPYDMQIAAIALVHNLILITRNMREFSRIEGLQIENWENNA